MIRKMDDLGRVVIPIEIVRQFNLEKKCAFDVTADNGRIVLTPAPGRLCRCCHKESNELVQVGNLPLCKDCIKKFSSLAHEK